jgi:hypothetical protein
MRVFEELLSTDESGLSRIDKRFLFVLAYFRAIR